MDPVNNVQCILENYDRLRGKLRMEMPLEDIPAIDDVPEAIHNTLEACRIIFILKNKLNFQNEFKEGLEEFLKEEKLIDERFSHEIHLESTIKHYDYNVFQDKDGHSYVKLRYTKVTIPAKKLYRILEGCERIIRQLVEEHVNSKLTLPKCDDSCTVCQCDKLGKILIFPTNNMIQESSTNASTANVESLGEQPIETTEQKGPITSEVGQDSGFDRGSETPGSLDPETKDEEKLPDTTVSNVPTKPEKTEPENNPSPPEKCANYELVMNICQKQENFYEENKKEIHQARKKDPCRPKCVLLYRDKSQKCCYKLFADKQTALKWIHDNRSLVEDCCITTQVFGKDGELKITDLKLNKIVLINPSTGEDCSRPLKGSLDTGAQSASWPDDPDAFKSLIHGVTTINGRKTPIVYAQLMIDGEKIDRIFEIEIECDKEWCAIGLEQMPRLSTATATGVLQKIQNKVVKQ